VTALLCSCSQKENGEPYTSSITTEEESGAKDVERLFGGKCIYSRDTSLPQGLTIQLTNSDSIEEQNPNKELSSVAETFCKNIKNRKSKYKSLCVTLVYKDKTQIQKRFLMENLDLAIKKMPLINNILRFIRSAKYDSIQSLLASYIMVDIHSSGYYRSNMINKLKDIDSSGIVTDIYPYDFWVEHIKNGKDMFQFIGVVNREKENYDLNILVNAANGSDSIYMIIYKPEGYYSHDIRYKLTKP
jgi:hypothetical protein